MQVKIQGKGNYIMAKLRVSDEMITFLIKYKSKTCITNKCTMQDTVDEKSKHT